MNENNLKKLWVAVSKKFDVDDYESFKSRMSTPEQRKRFYKLVMSKGYDLGDYNEYEKRLSTKGTQQSKIPPTKDNVNDINSYPPCIHGYGKPTPKGVKGNQWSIAGRGEDEGKLFFNDGQGYNTHDKTWFTYTCPESSEETWPELVRTYPTCVQKMGDPTSKGVNGDQWSIDGTGEFKGKIFFNNGKYYDTVTKKIGKYRCDEQDGVVLKSDTISSPTTTGTTTTGTTTTGATTTVTKPKPKGISYIACPGLPCKFGTKNPKIKEIQTWLGFPKKYQTGNFGPITRKGLKDAMIDISKGITDTVYNELKNDHNKDNLSTIPTEPKLNPSGTSGLSVDDTQPGNEGSIYNPDGTKK